MNSNLSDNKKKLGLFLLFLLVVTLSGGTELAFAKKGDDGPRGGFYGPAAGVEVTGGFSGPGPEVVTVKQALAMSDKDWVCLKGNITQSLGDKEYIFKDASGSVNVKIGHKEWQGQMIGPNDVVEVRGRVKKDWTRTGIKVKEVIKRS